MKAPNRERQRKRKEGRGAENRSDTVMLPVTSRKICDTIKQFHPYKKEILNVVRILDSIEVNFKIIAATLGLKGWKTFYGGGEWTEEDVKDILVDMTNRR